MIKVFSAHAVSVDGFISGRDPSDGSEFGRGNLHQVPVLLGAGRSFFGELPEHVQLRPVEVVPVPGVTHLRYEVLR